MMSIALHFQNYLRKHQEQFSIQAFGELKLTKAAFQQLMEGVKDVYGHGWSKKYREMPYPAIAKELFEMYQEWEMAEVESETGMLVFKPVIARMVGHYPSDYKAGD